MKRQTKKVMVFVCGLMVVIISSCKEKITNREQLVAVINKPENGLKKTEQIGPVTAALTYKPWQLMMPVTGSKKEIKLKNDLYKLKNELFFVLSLAANNQELLRQLPCGQYSEMVQVLAFRMNKYIVAYPDDREPVQ